MIWLPWLTLDAHSARHILGATHFLHFQNRTAFYSHLTSDGDDRGRALQGTRIETLIADVDSSCVDVTHSKP
jgi:hypothetical protein